MDGEPFRNTFATICRWCQCTCEEDDICCADMAYYLGWRFPNSEAPIDWPAEELAAWHRGQEESDGKGRSFT